MVPAWTSGAAWFDALMDALATTEGDAVRRRVSVARDTVLRVARRDWQSADVATGRGVTTAHATIAAELGMAKKTVQRAREIIQELGYAVTVLEGSYLTKEERKAAREHHGGFQLRAASTRALTLPKPSSSPSTDPQSVENVHLPRRATDLKKSSFNENSPTRTGALGGPAAQSKESSKKSPPAGRIWIVEKPRTLDVHQFAFMLAERMPWLVRGRHIGQLMNVLERAGVDVKRWTVQELMDAIEQFSRTAALTIKEPADQRNPLAYFAWLLRGSVDPDGPTPSESREIERLQILEEQNRFRAMVERDRERSAASDPAEVAAALARMKADAAASADRGRAALRTAVRADGTRSPRRL